MAYDDSYEDLQVEAAPYWLTGEWGEKWHRVMGVMKDALSAAARHAVRARYPSKSAEDAYEHQAETRNLDSSFSETALEFRTRIKHGWTTWTKQGTLEGMQEALELAGYTNYQIHERVGPWYAFEITIFQPFPWGSTLLADGLWDDPGTWDDGGNWAEDIPAAHWDRLQALIRKHKGTNRKCKRVVLVYSGETWDTPPGGIWDDPGTWDGVASYLIPV